MGDTQTEQSYNSEDRENSESERSDRRNVQSNSGDDLDDRLNDTDFQNQKHSQRQVQFASTSDVQYQNSEIIPTRDVQFYHNPKNNKRFVEYVPKVNKRSRYRNVNNPGKLNLDPIAEYEDGPKCPHGCPFVSYEFKWHQINVVFQLVTITIINFISLLAINKNEIIGVIMIMIMTVVITVNIIYIWQVWKKPDIYNLDWNLKYILINAMNLSLIYLFCTSNISLLIMQKLNVEIFDEVIPTFSRAEYAIFILIIVFVPCLTISVFYSIWVHVGFIREDR